MNILESRRSQKEANKFLIIPMGSGVPGGGGSLGGVQTHLEIPKALQKSCQTQPDRCENC